METILGLVVIGVPALLIGGILLGIVYLLLCCLSWAIYTIVTKPLLAKYDSFTVTAVTMLVAAPVLIGAATEPLPQLFSSLTIRQWGELFYLVIPNGLLGTFLWNYGTKHLSGTTDGLYLYLIPVIAVAAGAQVGAAGTPVAAPPIVIARQAVKAKKNRRTETST